MAKHRSEIAVRSDFTKYWSLPMFFNPKVKSVVVKCEMCNPRKKPYKRMDYKADTAKELKMELVTY